MNEVTKDLLAALQAALMWIDAVPSDTKLPTMPGFDRDDVDALIDETKIMLTKPVVELHQCDNCGHLSEGKPTACDCMPDVQTYTNWLAVPVREKAPE